MRHTVLVIDDQWSMQELARIVLQAAGYHVLLAGDGATGLSLARTQHPDVLLLDLRMTGMSSVDVLQGLRQDAHTASLPVILITTEGNTELLPSAMTPHTSLLHKPFHAPALLSMIDQLLHHEEMPIAV